MKTEKLIRKEDKIIFLIQRERRVYISPCKSYGYLMDGNRTLHIQLFEAEEKEFASIKEANLFFKEKSKEGKEISFDDLLGYNIKIDFNPMIKKGDFFNYF